MCFRNVPLFAFGLNKPTHRSVENNEATSILLSRVFASTLLIFIALGTYAQVAPFTASLNPKGEGGNIPEEKNAVWTERTNERTLFSSQFVDQKGNTKSVYSKKPIHYRSLDGDLRPISPRLKPVGKGVMAAPDQAYPTYLYADQSYGLNLGNNNLLLAGKNVHVNGEKYTAVKTSVSERGAESQQGSVRREIQFLEGRIKSNIVLTQPLTISNDYLLVQETVTLPTGFSLAYSSTENEEPQTDRRKGILFIDGFASHSEILVMEDKSNLAMGKIFTPLAYDASNRVLPLMMSFTSIGNDQYVLTVATPKAWLEDSERQYPITIDPLIGGPTSIWAGGYMPSCLTPQANIDSLLATVPAGVTVSGLYVTASFYADPFAPATMNQGVMSFSTKCGISQTFTVTGPTALTAGTAYLDSFNVMSPLICCIPESCDTTQLYVRYHLSRYTYGPGCNINYIRYDPFTTLWPFQVVIYGKTAESYGSQWYASQAPLCSNECEIEVTAYARYGVAPYTFTHPWSTDTIVTGTNTGCGAGATNHHFFLTIPNCPTYCDSTETLLNIPPPVVTDACGTLIAGIPIETVPIKPATNIVLQYDSILCSGENINVSLASCFSNGTAYYWGEGLSGQGSFSANASTNGLPVVLLFNAYAAGDGCVSDTTQFTLSIYSNPIANYTINPSPIIVGMQGDFSDASVSPAASISQWTWTVDDTLTSLSTQWSNVYQTPGNHTLCLFIQDTMGCVDTLCGPFSVVPATVNAPNVVTPNGDSKNDLLAFQYLEFYEKNKLQIFNRWGNLIYEKENYLNDWNGSEVKDGTYFYTLDITDKKETLSGFFYLIK